MLHSSQEQLAGSKVITPNGVEMLIADKSSIMILSDGAKAEAMLLNIM